jgi:hypothetical protein
MSQQSAQTPDGVPGPAGAVPIDVVALLAAMQDQIDDLAAALNAQQRSLDELVRGRRATTEDVAVPVHGPRDGHA